jgi:hypothetical protein
MEETRDPAGRGSSLRSINPRARARGRLSVEGKEPGNRAHPSSKASRLRASSPQVFPFTESFCLAGSPA